MSDIYAQHDKAFAKVSAWVILNAEGERIATVAIKYPRDGAGRLYAYTHFRGVPMTRHSASGYGYDKRSPAIVGGFAHALAVLRLDISRLGQDVGPAADTTESRREFERLAAFVAAFANGDGEYWDRLLERAGYRVLQAV